MKWVGAAAQRAPHGQTAPRFVLVSGPDAGMVRRLADDVVAALVRASPDLSIQRFGEDDLKSDPARIVQAVSAASLFGGATLARLRVAGEREGAALIKLMTEFDGRPPDGAIVAEGGDLGRTSKTRKAFEDASHAWSLQLYAASRSDLEKVGKEAAAAASVTLAPHAMADILEAVAQDVDSVAAEVAKLAIWAGPAGTIDMDALAAVGSGGREAGVDDAVNAAFLGKPKEAIVHWDRALAAGANAIVGLNAIGRRVKTLLNVRLSMEGGASASDAVRNPRLGVMWLRQADVATQAGRWPRAALEEVLAACVEADAQVKRSAMPTAAMVERLLLRIAKRGQSSH
jgi:DNA polymerase III subunit delta